MSIPTPGDDDAAVDPDTVPPSDVPPTPSQPPKPTPPPKPAPPKSRPQQSDQGIKEAEQQPDGAL